MAKSRKEALSGQAAIEFALILPIAVLLLALAADAASLFRARSALSAASSEAARALNVDPGIPLDELTARAQAAAGSSDTVELTVAEGAAGREEVPMVYDGRPVAASYSTREMTVTASTDKRVLLPLITGSDTVHLESSTSTVVSGFSTGGRP